MKRSAFLAVLLGVAATGQVRADETPRPEARPPAEAAAPAAPDEAGIVKKPLPDDMQQLRQREHTLVRNLAMVRDRLQLERDPDVVAAKKAIDAARAALDQTLKEKTRLDAEGARVLDELAEVQGKMKALTTRSQPGKPPRLGDRPPTRPRGDAHKITPPNPPILK
ncbi:MAG: hypothetical protein BWZ02_03082 [Lentisphaerae bacterium ADurb.BinA184]|nr:MAG: hypothetical protein BWZ02_03082 [Lentisphaerae bacterium ADurb.BinA184]